MLIAPCWLATVLFINPSSFLLVDETLTKKKLESASQINHT